MVSHWWGGTCWTLTSTITPLALHILAHMVSGSAAPQHPVIVDGGALPILNTSEGEGEHTALICHSSAFWRCCRGNSRKKWMMRCWGCSGWFGWWRRYEDDDEDEQTDQGHRHWQTQHQTLLVAEAWNIESDAPRFILPLAQQFWTKIETLLEHIHENRNKPFMSPIIK